MFIGIVFVILIGGQAVQDYAAFPTEAECVKASAELEKHIVLDKKVAGYTIQCLSLDSLKKPGLPA